jgi:hypothetical protein
MTTAFRDWGAWMLVAAGLVWCAYGVLTLDLVPSYWAAASFGDRLAVGLYSGGLLLLGVGVAAIHAHQAERAGTFARVACYVAIAGAVFAGVGDFAEDGLRIAPAVNAYFAGMALLTVGLVAYGIATLVKRVLPAACGVLLLLSVAVGHALGGLWSAWPGTLVFGLLWLALGGLLLLLPSRETAVSARRRR